MDESGCRSDGDEAETSYLLYLRRRRLFKGTNNEGWWTKKMFNAAESEARVINIHYPERWRPASN